MECVSSPHRKPLELNASQLAKRIGRQHLAPGAEQCLQPVSGNVVSPVADCSFLSQPLEHAPDLDTRSPPDDDRVLLQESLSRARALPGDADVNDRACVPEGRHILFAPRQSPAGSLSLS